MPVPIQSNHMQIYKHEYTRIIQTTQSCYVIIQLIHQNQLTWDNDQTRTIQFESLDLTHFNTKTYFRVTIPRNSKTLGFSVPTLNNLSVHFVNPHFSAILGLFQIKAYINT